MDGCLDNNYCDNLRGIYIRAANSSLNKGKQEFLKGLLNISKSFFLAQKSEKE